MFKNLHTSIILLTFAVEIVGGHVPANGGFSTSPFSVCKVELTKKVDDMGRKKTLEEVKAAFKDVWGDRYIYDLITEENYVDMNTPVTVVCSKHGCKHDIRPSDHVKGLGCCPQCKSENISKKKKGIIKEKKGKVFGVGINDSLLPVGCNNVAYRRWVAMLHRCYGNFSKKHPTYSVCSVCEEWLVFSNFEKWFNENYKDGYELDKDLLSGKENKVYSPETCCFLPQRINKLILTNKGRRSNIIGSSKKGDKWESFISALDEDGKKKRIHLGYFNSPQEAFAAYKLAKESYVKEVAQKYYDNGDITKRVYDALMSFTVNIND